MRAQRKLTAVALTILFSAGVAFAGTSRVEPKGLWDSLMSLISSPTLENVGGAITRPGTQNVGGAAPNVGGAGPVTIERPGTPPSPLVPPGSLADIPAYAPESERHSFVHHKLALDCTSRVARQQSPTMRAWGPGPNTGFLRPG